MALSVDAAMNHLAGFTKENLDAMVERPYPPVPTDCTHFQRDYRAEEAKKVHRWEWSTTFGQWGAVVTFHDGKVLFTFPA